MIPRSRPRSRSTLSRHASAERALRSRLHTASDDIEAASRWYERERSGYGAVFLDELWRVLELLVRTPEIGPTAHLDLRRIILRRFPYSIYYRVTGSVIQVRACLHLRQHPYVARRRA